MAYNKIGFLSSGSGGNPTGIGNYVRACDAKGIPAVVLCNDGVVGIDDALRLIENGSTVKHVMGFRVALNDFYGTPRYELSPKDAALELWGRIRPHFHPRVIEHKDKIWIFPHNEVDKNLADWLGWHALELAKIANAQGYKIMCFAFASGEPEYEHWLTPGMVAYLRYCDQNLDKAGICPHEYSYKVNDILFGYPYLIGRFKFLHDVCDTLGVRYPKMIMGEWGWTQDTNPDPSVALQHIDTVAAIYAKHSNILGAGIWYLGPYLGVANYTQKLIAPVTQLTISKEYEGDTMARGTPRIQYNREYWAIHGSVSADQARNIFNQALSQRITVGWSFDDAGIGDLDVRRVVAFGVPATERQNYLNWYAQYYPGVTVEFREAPATGSGFRSQTLAR